MIRWSDRLCTCQHSRFMHAGSPIGYTKCSALRCGCHIFDAVWAARLWGAWNRGRTRD